MKCVCNKNCFNCIHPDCILEDDAITYTEIKQAESRDKEIIKERELEEDAEAEKKNARLNIWEFGMPLILKENGLRDGQNMLD